MILRLVMSNKNVYYASVLASLRPAWGIPSIICRKEVMFPAKLVCSVSTFLFLLLGACSKENKSSARSADKVPADFNLIFGDGGGFTGLWQGYTVDANGAIYSWQGKIAGENAKPAGKFSAKQMKSLWREIQKADLFTQELDEHGNMTSIMRVTANGATKELAWIPQLGATTAATSAPQELRKYCQTLVEKAVKK
jgi:hypothetical protein